VFGEDDDDAISFQGNLTVYTDSADVYDASYSSFDFAAGANRLHDLITRHKRTTGSTLLDVACGTGTYLTHLGDRYTVEGVDLSPAMLAIAKRKLPNVPLHEADMVEFNLGRRFDAVVCLGSSIGYTKRGPRLRRAIATLARHALSGGVVVVEPWIWPDAWENGRLTTDLVDQPDLKVARMLVSGRIGRVSMSDIHHLVARLGGVEYFVEHHELGLFTHTEYLADFKGADLEVTYESQGLLGLPGRGAYIGVRR